MTSSETHSAPAIGQATGVPRQGGLPPGTDPAAPESAAAIEPAVESSAVRLRRLAGVAIWALCLVLAGSASAIVSLFHIFGGGPGWFTPTFITIGVLGMLLTMMAFATLRFKGVPWMFMTAATATLLAAFVMLSMI